MTGSFDRNNDQEKGGYWANRLAAFLFLASIITLFFVPFNAQIPTKWTLNGEPSQFVSAWLALFIMPISVIILSMCIQKRRGRNSNTRTERRGITFVSIVGAILLTVCHGMIILAAIAGA